MDRVELGEYRRRHRKVRRWSFGAVIALAAGIGYALTELWSRSPPTSSSSPATLQTEHEVGAIPEDTAS